MIRKTLSLFLIFFFLPLFLVTTLALSLKTTIFDKEFVKKSLVETNTYEKFYPVLAENLIKSLNEGDEFDFLEASDLETVSQKIFPQSELKSLTENIVDQLSGHLFSEKNNLEISLDLKKYKENFNPSLKTQIMGLIEKLPKCRSNTEIKLNELPKCTPNISAANLYRQTGIDNKLMEILITFPDKIIITPEAVRVEPRTAEFSLDPQSKLFMGVREVRKYTTQFDFWLAVLVAANLVGVILLLILRLPNWRSIFTWLGWTLFLSGFVTLVISLVLLFASQTALANIEMLEESVKTADLLKGLGDYIISKFTNRNMIIASTTVICGVILIVTPLLKRDRHANEESEKDLHSPPEN